MMDILRIVKLHATEIIYDPEAAADAVAKACSRGNVPLLPSGCCDLGEGELLISLAKAEGSEAEPEEKPEGPHDKDVLDAFLDAQTSEEKLDILTGSWKTVTEDNIDNIAVVLDMELTGETLEEKYKEILNCLKLRAKYESSRLR